MYLATDTHKSGWTFQPSYARSDRDGKMPHGAKVACHVEKMWLATWPHGETPTTTVNSNL